MWTSTLSRYSSRINQRPTERRGFLTISQPANDSPEAADSEGPSSPRQVITVTAIYGTFALMPGIFPVVFGDPPLHFDVEPLWLEALKDAKRGLDIPAADCTTFRVIHHSRPWPITIDESIASTLFDDALSAISEVLLWFKKTMQGPAAQHARQVGRVDVKFFSIAGDADGSRLAWLTPLRRPPQAIHNIFPRIRMTNGPAFSPTLPDVRRFQASVDLWNLGFFTESFITGFALLDDIVQDVLRSGLMQRGISRNETNELLRAVRENRLQRYLTGLMTLAGWRNLAEDDPEMFGALLKSNRLRNDIMHGSARLSGVDGLEHLATLRSVLGWLAANPFGRLVPPLPPIDVVMPDFILLEEQEEPS